MPLRKLTGKASSNTNLEDLWVRLCLKFWVLVLIITVTNGTSKISTILTYLFLSTGYLIGLKDPELALAVEVCLKYLLVAFTCDNYDDEKVLKSLMSKVYRGGQRPTIITSQFLHHVHDTRRR